jgi:hypothetical protein
VVGRDVEAVFAVRAPKPGIAELRLLLYLYVKRAF